MIKSSSQGQGESNNIKEQAQQNFFQNEKDEIHEFERNSGDLNLKSQVKSNTSTPSKGVIEQIPESCRQDIVQSNLAHSKLHNTMQKMNTLAINSVTDQQIYSRFFIIKSYSEENVQMAFKHKIWSSTVRGNQILDNAYNDLHKFKKMKYTELDDEDEKAINQAQIYLLFSVN